MALHRETAVSKAENDGSRAKLRKSNRVPPSRENDGGRTCAAYALNNNSAHSCGFLDRYIQSTMGNDAQDKCGRST